MSEERRRIHPDELAERWGSSDLDSVLRQIGAVGDPPGGGQDKGLVDRLKDSLSGQ